MYVLTVKGIMYFYETEKEARKEFHKNVSVYGLNNVKIQTAKYNQRFFSE